MPTSFPRDQVALKPEKLVLFQRPARVGEATIAVDILVATTVVLVHKPFGPGCAPTILVGRETRPAFLALPTLNLVGSTEITTATHGIFLPKKPKRNHDAKHTFSIIFILYNI